MRTPSAATLVAAALAFSAPARAQPTAALRIGYAPALGGLARSVPISDAMSSHVPLQLDVLWRLGPFSAGAYGSWGPGQVGAGACGAGASCSASVFRAGAQGIYALEPLSDTRIVPWGGLGLGWEWASQRRERLGSRTSWSWSGAELSLQGGAEWPIAGRFAIGPVALLGFGRYGREALETSAASASAAIQSKAVHVWIHVGVRGRIDF